MFIIPKLALSLLISGALLFVGLAAAVLIMLFIRDAKGGQIW